MIFSRNVKFELSGISIVENPINERGKYIRYSFRMFQPFWASFIKKYDNKNISIIWSNDTGIDSYTQEGRKELEIDIKKMIAEHMPDLFTIDNLISWRLSTTHDSPRNDRKWMLSYSCRNYDRKTKGIHHTYDGWIESVDQDFINKLIHDIPIDKSILIED